jgi:anaerobic ribonucleoside-triphosphate reductase activating protein
MQIEKCFDRITALGPGERLVIWTLGCPRMCMGCANPELRLPDPMAETDLVEFLGKCDLSSVTGVTISGGDPFMQAGELAKLVKLLKLNGIDDIIVFTGYTHGELRDIGDDDINYVLENIAVLIDGPFELDKCDDRPMRGSSNQNIVILNEKFSEAFEEYLKGEKALDIVRLSNNEVHFVGIPPRDYKELYGQYLKTK